MNSDAEHRKLVAIMFTDMVGYSALVQRNESLALELLEEHRRLLRDQFPKFGGREVETTGDGFLVEFASALEAARCAIEIQRAMASRNIAVPAERRIQLRIGIHVGDVVHKEGHVLGDGVNIAARLQPLAEPGGICISVDVARQVQNNLEATVVKLGQTSLKNIRLPMEICRIVLPWETAAIETRATDAPGPPAIAGPGAANPQSSARRLPGPWVLSVAVLLLILAGVIGGWYWHKQGNAPVIPKTGNQITSLAVKPLDDFSGDTNQAYLSDGMTEALCAALGNISALRVPGRSSVMRYKQGQKTIQEMAKELNVQAIVEGSIQRAGNRIMVTAQLIDAATDRHLWATNYQRDLSDFFTVQSELARSIAAEIQVRLAPEDLARLAHTRAVDPQVIEACLQGMHHYWQEGDEKEYMAALRSFQKAIEIDPNYAPAYAGMSLTYCLASELGYWQHADSLSKARQAALRSIALDPALSDGHAAMGLVDMYAWDWTGAAQAFKRALQLNPKSTVALNNYAIFLLVQGRFEEAVVMQKKALEFDPLSPFLLTDLSYIYMHMALFDQALVYANKALELDRHFVLAHTFVAESLLGMGKTSEALAEYQAAVQLSPGDLGHLQNLAYALAVSGRRDEAMKMMEDYAKLDIKGSNPSGTGAGIYLALGQKELALDRLEKDCEERKPGMIYLAVNPAFKALRNEPRFQALLKKMGLPPDIQYRASSSGRDQWRAMP